MLANINMVNQMAMASINGLMVIPILAYSQMDINMVKVNGRKSQK
jgi:hypothetical protein